MRRLAAVAAVGGALMVGVMTGAANGTAQACDPALRVSPGGKTLDQVYRLACPGQDVPVDAGAYPAQALTRDASKVGAAPVRFVPQGPVTINGNLSSGISGGSVTSPTGAASWEITSGITVTGEVALKWGSDDVRLVNVDAGNLRITSAKRVQIIGGDFGPYVDQVGTINSAGGSAPGPEDILIDGAYFHDYTISDPAKHSECLQIWPGAASSNVVIRNTDFRNCTDFGVLVKAPNLTGLVFDNVTLDSPMPGNVATVTCNPDCPRGGSSIRFSTYKYPGAKVLNSRMAGSLSIDIAGYVEVVNTCSKCDPTLAAAPTLSISAKTATTVTLTWPSLPVASYGFYRDGVRVSTGGPLRTSVKFGLLVGTHTYSVEAVYADGRKARSDVQVTR